MSATTAPATPLLQAGLDAGHIALIDHEFVGYASDGVEVALGYDFDLAPIERYLTVHPTPDTW